MRSIPHGTRYVRSSSVRPFPTPASKAVERRLISLTAWVQSSPFGWEDKADGFRGHVFLSPDNATVVLSIKGTTLQGPTSKKDKFNDNLLFSCCCARVDITWIFRQVCDCYAKHWRCDNTCLTDALVQDSLFYNVGVVR